jgi:hypothetical protein
MNTVKLRSVMGGTGKTTLARVLAALETVTDDGAALPPAFALKIARAIRGRVFLRKAHDRFEKVTRHDECLAFPVDRAAAADHAAWQELLAAVADLPSDQLPHILAMLRHPKQTASR